MSIIVGVDPGSRFLGYGVIEWSDGAARHLAHGVIALPETLSFSARLGLLGKKLNELFQKWPQAEAVVEKVFFGKNADSAFKLGHARGVCLMAAAQAGYPVFEYATREVKKSVTGNGAASKEEVLAVVQQWLKIKVVDRLDATDALALALCHGQKIEVSRRLQQNGAEGVSL